jgi:hypothetical protein
VKKGLLLFLALCFSILLTIWGGYDLTSKGEKLLARPVITFEKTYKGFTGYSVAQTSDGGYIIVGEGHTNDPDRTDVFLLKTDGKGNKMWEKTFGGPGDDYGSGLVQTVDRGYVIVGGTFSISKWDWDVYLIKTDLKGNKIWEKTLGGEDKDWGSYITRTSDGGYLISGTTRSFGLGSYNLYLVKTDSHGNKIWEKAVPEGLCGSHIAPTNDGCYVIVGNTGFFGAANIDVYLLKVDTHGRKIWEKALGGSGDDLGNCVSQTSDGGYIIVGQTDSFGSGKSDVYLVKTDENGNLIWQKTFGGQKVDEGHSVIETKDGGYLIGGITNSFGTGEYDYDIYLVKTDAKGNKLWEKTFGGKGLNECRCVAQTNDGGFIITGSIGGHICLIKTDSRGNVYKEER